MLNLLKDLNSGPSPASFAETSMQDTGDSSKLTVEFDQHVQNEGSTLFQFTTAIHFFSGSDHRRPLGHPYHQAMASIPDKIYQEEVHCYLEK